MSELSFRLFPGEILAHIAKNLSKADIARWRRTERAVFTDGAVAQEFNCRRPILEIAEGYSVLLIDGVLSVYGPRDHESGMTVGELFRFDHQEEDFLEPTPFEELAGQTVLRFLSQSEDYAPHVRWTYVFTEDDGLYSFGHNRFGQLGRPACEEVLRPAKITDLPSVPIQDIVTIGSGTTFLVCREQIYVMGALAPDDPCKPSLMASLPQKPIQKVIEKFDAVFVLYLDEEIWKIDCNPPVRMDDIPPALKDQPLQLHAELQGKNVKAVVESFAQEIVYFQCDDGLYVTGRAFPSVLGLGQGATSEIPIGVPFFKDKSIRQVVAGNDTIYVLCHEGLFVFSELDPEAQLDLYGRVEPFGDYENPYLIPRLNPSKILSIHIDPFVMRDLHIVCEQEIILFNGFEKGMTIRMLDLPVLRARANPDALFERYLSRVSEQRSEAAIPLDTMTLTELTQALCQLRRRQGDYLPDLMRTGMLIFEQFQNRTALLAWLNHYAKKLQSRGATFQQRTGGELLAYLKNIPEANEIVDPTQLVAIFTSEYSEEGMTILKILDQDTKWLGELAKCFPRLVKPLERLKSNEIPELAAPSLHSRS